MIENKCNNCDILRHFIFNNYTIIIVIYYCYTNIFIDKTDF